MEISISTSKFDAADDDRKCSVMRVLGDEKVD